MTMEVKPYAIEAGKRAIEEHLKRVNLHGRVYEGPNSGTYGIDYEVKIREPRRRKEAN